MRTHNGHLARILHACTDQTMTAALAEMDLTAAQSHIMCYITHRKEPPCPRDIEEAFQLTHPTVSGILSRLEQKGFIQMRPDAQDRRCKRIFVLEKGMELDEMIHQVVRSMEEKMVQNFTEEEKVQFTDLLRRAIANMGADPCKRKHKEEPEK
ncbi:MAG: MarR family transcriptional regulator [Oscillospiraceae bacterium]|nr:MarR family transcriptional regulator [Oscillospiraceae bacterium]